MDDDDECLPLEFSKAGYTCMNLILTVFSGSADLYLTFFYFLFSGLCIRGQQVGKL
jgi:hypothetical protein